MINKVVYCVTLRDFVYDPVALYKRKTESVVDIQHSSTNVS